MQLRCPPSSKSPLIVPMWIPPPCSCLDLPMFTPVPRYNLEPALNPQWRFFHMLKIEILYGFFKHNKNDPKYNFPRKLAGLPMVRELLLNSLKISHKSHNQNKEKNPQIKCPGSTSAWCLAEKQWDLSPTDRSLHPRTTNTWGAVTSAKPPTQLPAPSIFSQDNR